MLRRGALTLLVLMAGCDRMLGIEELPRRSGAARPQFVVPECGACEHDNCAEPALACDRDPVCANLHRCLAKCAADDARCRAACEDAEPTFRASDPYKALDSCRRTTCRAICLGDDSLAKLLPTGCECLARSCQAASAACMASPPREGMTGDCERAWACFAAVDALDPDVVSHCTRRYGAGGTELVALSQCTDQQSCSTCTRGDPFACVGRYSWRAGTIVRPKLKFTVVNDEGNALAGARVDACVTPLCGSCGHDPTSTFSSGVSEKDGAVTLELAGGFTGCFHAEHPDYAHTHVVWTRPVVENEAPVSLETIGLLRETTLDLLFATIGAKRNPDLAQALFVARDCIFAAAAGVTLDPLSDPSATVLYVRDSLPTTTPPTDKSGTVVVANLAPGTVTFRVRAGATVVSERTFVARPGHLHDVRMLPTPR